MLLHKRGVDEDDLEHHDEDGDSNNEGDGQPNAKVVQKDLEKYKQTMFIKPGGYAQSSQHKTITCAHTV